MIDYSSPTGPSILCALQAVEQALVRIEARASLNAFALVDKVGAKSRADILDKSEAGDFPLKGKVMAVKDNVHVAGLPNTAGTTALREFVPKTSASIVTALQDAGAVVVGKAGMHELALGITSNNFVFGAVRNPANEDAIPGGSSGGSAAAVAAGLVDLAIGTDTGGSLRLPAALTGTVGFRPTTGRYPNDGVTTLSTTRDTVGFITRDVTDMVLYDGFAVGSHSDLEAPDLNGIRIGVPHAYFYDNLDPDVAQACENTFSTLTKAGVELVSVDLAEAAVLCGKAGLPIVLYETNISLRRYLSVHNTGITSEQLVAGIKSPDVLPVVQAALEGAISRADYEEALNKERLIAREIYARCFVDNRLDAIIFPTSPITARPIEGILEGVEVPGEDGLQDTFSTYIRNTEPSTVVGIPGISIPAGLDSMGLPIGIELDGPENSDEELLALALAIEAILQESDT